MVHCPGSVRMEAWVSRWNANREKQAQSELPPGQRLQRGWPVTHYGPVPKFRPERWEFRVFGATADGEKHCWNHEEFTALPYATVVADLHCVTKFSMLGAEWGGIPAAHRSWSSPRPRPTSPM